MTNEKYSGTLASYLLSGPILIPIDAVHFTNFSKRIVFMVTNIYIQIQRCAIIKYIFIISWYLSTEELFNRTT